MNNILKIFISLLFFLLLITTAGQEEYASVKSSFFQKSNVTSSYQQTQSPCKKTMDFLFINRFADMPQVAIALDNPDLTSKSKCALRLLATLNDFWKQELQTTYIFIHPFHITRMPWITISMHYGESLFNFIKPSS
jgi:hypothetical protein